MKRPDFKRLYDIMFRHFRTKRCFSSGPLDETYYSLRVFITADQLIKRLGRKVDEDAILVAALLHDLGKTKLDQNRIMNRNGFKKAIPIEWRRHAALSGPIARRILEKEGYDDTFIDKVCYLIVNHDKRKDIEKTIELQILQDADLIADSGMSGFIRPFLYAGMFGRPTGETVKYIQTMDTRTTGHRLNLAISKPIVKAKVRRENELIREIVKELKTDRL